MAMNDMLADILKKAIPPEVMAMLSEEKIRDLGNQAKMAVENLNNRLSAIEATQAKIMEYMENANGSNNSRKPKRAGSASDANGSVGDGSD